MFPVILNIPIFGGLRIYTYGVLFALGILAAIFWIARDGKRVGIREELVYDLSFYIIIGILVGSRILHILTEWEAYSQNPMKIFKIWEGGLAFQGGLVGALIVSYVYLKKHHLSFLKVSDLFMPGVSLGHAIGRLGCFAAGCCYGKVSHSGFSVIFPATPYSLAPVGVPLFPSQLVESAASLLIFIVLTLLRKKTKFDGQILCLYLALYGIVRFILEFFRGETLPENLILHRFSVYQVISFFLVSASVVVLLIALRTSRSGQTQQQKN